MFKVGYCVEKKTGVTLDAEEVALLNEVWRALVDDVKARGHFEDVMINLAKERP